MTDVSVENHGSIILFRPLTDGAREWLQENTGADSWQWFGGALAVEPRYAGALAEGMMGEGFNLE